MLKAAQLAPRYAGNQRSLSALAIDNIKASRALPSRAVSVKRAPRWDVRRNIRPARVTRLSFQEASYENRSLRIGSLCPHWYVNLVSPHHMYYRMNAGNRYQVSEWKSDNPILI